MKTRIIILAAVVTLFTISVASTSSNKNSKITNEKKPSTEVHNGRGLAMEDKDQFN